MNSEEENLSLDGDGKYCSVFVLTLAFVNLLVNLKAL